MKIVVWIARILLSLVFVVFGLNGFLHFLKGPLPPGLAGQFLGALMESHYVLLVAGVQIAGGALLLVNRYVPLGLVLLGPVIVNILAFHLFMLPSQSFMAVLVAILWGIVAFYHRQSFASLFVAQAS
jgi:hypothetical protein